MTEGFDDLFHSDGVKLISGETDDVGVVVAAAGGSGFRGEGVDGTGARKTIGLHGDSVSRAAEQDTNPVWVGGDGLGDGDSGVVKVIVFLIFVRPEILHIYVLVTAAEQREQLFLLSKTAVVGSEIDGIFWHVDSFLLVN